MKLRFLLIPALCALGLFLLIPAALAAPATSRCPSPEQPSRCLSLSKAEGPITPLPQPEISGQWLAGTLLVLLSVALEFVPNFRAWWERFAFKREFLAAAGLLLTIGLVGLHYAGAFDADLGPFGWPVIGRAFNAWLALLGGDWLIFSLAHRAKTLPRQRQGQE